MKGKKILLACTLIVAILGINGCKNKSVRDAVKNGANNNQVSKNIENSNKEEVSKVEDKVLEEEEEKDTRVKEWVEDINYVVKIIKTCHPSPYDFITEEDFDKEVGELIKEVPSLSDEKIRVKMAKIVADIKDLHTFIDLQSDNTLYLPLSFNYFEDDLYLLYGLKDFEDSLGKKLVEVNGKPVKEFIAELSTVVSYENEHGMRARIEEIIGNCDVLYGLGLANKEETVKFTLEDDKGNRESLEVNPKTRDEMVSSQLNNNYKNLFKATEIPLYMKNFNNNYSYEYIDEEKTMYFDYNSCYDDKNLTFSKFANNLVEEISKCKPQKLVIDLRFNLGGMINLEVFTNRYKELGKEIVDNCKVYVLTNKNTMSQAVITTLDAKKELNAVIVGEPAGQPSKFYAGIMYMPGDNNKLNLAYSGQKWYFSDYELDVIEPDVYIPLKVEDFEYGKDPVMEYIFND